jgi:hypothetical protein
MRTDYGYYGYTSSYGNEAKQACFNQAIYYYGQTVIGHIYYDNATFLYYTSESGSDQAANGTYLTTLAGSPWDNPSNIYTEVSGQTPPTTSAPTTGSPTTQPATTEEPGSTGEASTTEGPFTPPAPQEPPEGMTLFNVAVYIRVGITDIIVRGQIWAEIDLLTPLPPPYICKLNKEFISYPDSRAYKIVLWANYESSIWGGEIALRPSKAYNYAFAVMQPYITVLLYEMSVPSISTNRSYKEDDVIIVSEAANPFFFPVEHSYRIPGKIRDLSMMASRTLNTYTGIYPIVVLTNRGIFALEQGSGIVLYSNVAPISNDICERGCVLTKYGIAYIANDAVNILEGSTGVNISIVLDKGLPDTSIRSCPGFIASVEGDIYNISGVLSQVRFADYLIDAILLYDNTNKEIIVSNPAYGYSYVYSITSESWHKISEVFSYYDNYRFALKKAGIKKDVVEVGKEIKTGGAIVHIQTRPVNLDSFGYKTISRSILRGLIRPYITGEILNYPLISDNTTTPDPQTTVESDATIYGFYVFGSNDLEEWKLVSARQTVINLANMRTNRVARSYRYFVFVSGGIVKPNHNLVGVEVEFDEKLDNKSR